MNKIDLASVPAVTGSNYPYPFNLPCSAQSSQRLATVTRVHQNRIARRAYSAIGVVLSGTAPLAHNSGRHCR